MSVMKIKLCFILLSVIFLYTNSNAQTVNERGQRIRIAVDAGDSKTAIAELLAFQKSDASIFSLNNYDYLVARLSQNKGDKATASSNYLAIVKRNSILTQHALWHLSEISRMTGNLNLEREQLRQILSSQTNSSLKNPAIERIAESLFESGEYVGAIQILKPIADSKASSASRKAMLMLAQSYLKSNQMNEAREAFTKLITEMQNPAMPDDYALEAAKALDSIEGGNQKEAPKLADPEHLRRALIYQFNRDFQDARLHFNAIITRYPQSPNVPDAMFQIGRGYFNERNYDEAITAFQKAISSFPESNSAKDSLGFLASSLGRLKRYDEAVSTYKRLIEKFPNADNPERPYINIIDTLRDAGRDDEALNWVEQTRNRFSGQMPAALALFAQLKIHFTQKAWDKALADCDLLNTEKDLGNLRVPNSTTQKEVAFMRAYTLEQLGKASEAINSYLSLTDGRNEYFGWQATLRLQAMASNENFASAISSKLTQLKSEAEKAINNNQADAARIAAQNAIRLTKDEKTRKSFLEILKRAYSQLPAYKNVPSGNFTFNGRDLLTKQITFTQPPLESQELYFLQLYDEAYTEITFEQAFLKKLMTDNKTTTEDKYSLAIIALKGDHADKAVVYAEPLWRNVPADYLPELAPRESVELLYPAPYKDSLLKHASAKGVDPRLVLSIMRQESRFRPEVKSVAAARGLMQFISATSNQIATQLGKNNFKQDELYNPDVAIEFGSQYLSNLFQLFPNSPQAVAASYNGGEDNMARWIARSRTDDAVHYVPEIAFAQSKDYVFKVLANYRVYQTLYDEKLQRR